MASAVMMESRKMSTESGTGTFQVAEPGASAASATMPKSSTVTLERLRSASRVGKPRERQKRTTDAISS